MYKPRRASDRPARIRTLDKEWVDRAVAEHLARYACTRAHLRTLLDRRIRRAERDGAILAPELYTDLDAALDRHVGLGTLDDAAWAERKARSLTRRGVGAAVVHQRLRHEGVADGAAALQAVTDELQGAPEEAEVSSDRVAACAWMRRKHVGPFSRGDAAEEADPDDRAAVRAARDAARGAEQKVLASMGRAGFSFTLAREVLGLSRDEAESLLARLR